VVLDEADEMLDLGFREDLERMLDATPAGRRMLLFSATLPRGIVSLAKRYQQNALRIALAPEGEAHGDIEYRAIPIAPHERDHAVVNVLRYYEARGALVFCSTRETVKRLHANLLERGFSVVALSGELTQADRTRALQALRDGRARVCVATDVAARGLDLPDLGLVIHADLPHDRDSVLHRSGRTGRAGRKGTCVMLVPYPGRRHAERLLSAAHVEAAWSPPPSADAIRARDQARLVEEIGALAEESSEEDLAAARALLAKKSPEELVAALVSSRRGLLPAPEELAESTATSATTMRPPRPRLGPEDSVWFRVGVGHAGNADPRWLLPFLCRRGHVTRDDIGRIRILDRESHVEVARSVAERFAAAARRPDGQDAQIRIDPLRGGPAPPPKRKRWPAPRAAR